ncbi:MAG TPA: hypothetical protein VGW39_13400 [Chthoniobacterales bacterium]|nr:hypothetical protein [Chthoniobacterales bacterium]
MRENDENLIEPGDFKNRPHAFLQTGQDKFAAVGFDVLHPFDQDRESGTVDVRNAREIDHQARGLFLDHRTQGRSDARRDVEVDFAFERQNVGSVG